MSYWVVLHPAHENAGNYQLDSAVAHIPDDVDFSTVYQTDNKEQALGLFDGWVKALSRCTPKDYIWLDRLNNCLDVGDLAQIIIYQIDTRNSSIVSIAESVLTVGGSIRRNG